MNFNTVITYSNFIGIVSSLNHSLDSSKYDLMLFKVITIATHKLYPQHVYISFQQVFSVLLELGYTWYIFCLNLLYT